MHSLSMRATILRSAYSRCPLPRRAGPLPGVIPHAQDQPPGPALSPAEAIEKMTVPPGFPVELVASEPDIVNPVAMTFDERGRIWITESLEYPRRAAGPGQGIGSRCSKTPTATARRTGSPSSPTG